ncbi:DHA2 family efflux MFS transporter permease subunit [Plantactinospora sp. S1510]|uniref:DHA2 family efflux MFS transporter permease subunit n=1 Tax=Plantactinospora alkalitolerans TaxID=2789879 RepID=A0ABS0H3V5_9ACTN|nr:DHA2 family efflux MFS transporter permease subunit [Plantactinospora alkalitolerans]MBF9133019.1 DHA2 family efflux MFS transporter permease subunit [Plantactinospora alkalitolerans]
MTMKRAHRWLILIVLCLSTVVLVIDNMALTVAVPSLAAELGASPQDTQWILDSYILVFAGLLLTAGSLSDRYGRRRVMVIGLTLFGAASLAAAIAADPVQLIAARSVMGAGGALIMPSTLSILITVFDAAERRRAMACWSAVAMLGLVGGPVLGGALIAHFHWGAVFLINVPIAALAIVAAFVLMPESKGPASRLDPLGAVLSTVGMTALIWTVIELVHGVSRPALTTAVLALGAFVAWELRTPHPMVPLGLFRHRAFSGGSLSLALVQIGNGGLLLILTQYLQYVLGFTPTQAGLAFIPMAVASLAFNTLGATVASGIGQRTLIASGLTSMAAGFGVLATLSPGTGFVQPAVGLFLLGAGGGLAMPAAVSALMSTIPAEHAGVGSALNDTVQQAGAALGVAVLGSIVSGAFTHTMSTSAPAHAARSIGDALAVAERTGDTVLADAARHAFTAAMSSAFVISAAGVLTAAAVALIVLRERNGAPRPAPRPAAARELTTAARPR